MHKFQTFLSITLLWLFALPAFAVTRYLCSTASSPGGTVSGPYVNEVSPLPVEMGFLEATPVEAGILIAWITFAETNNAYFTVEKSPDGINFKEAGRLNGFGNTSKPHSSNFLDIKPYDGISYYRIRQTEFDGNSTLSKTVATSWKMKRDLNIYPNPTFGDLFADLDEKYRNQPSQLTIYSETGKPVITKELMITGTGYGIKLLQTSEFLKPGKYLVTLKFNAQSLTEQIIVK